MIPLAGFEEITGASGAAPRIEASLPSGARARQLAVRTLLLGMMLALADGRPAHLTRVRPAPADLPAGRYTFGLVTAALGKDEPDGLPSPELQRACDDLLEPGPLSRAATPAQAAQHDERTAEAARYKLGRLTSDDADGYHRVQCPAAAGKVRCPLQPPSMTLDRDRPEILTPPEQPQACCTQQSLTVPPHVNAKTRQKHDYPSAAWRRSYARRSAAERGFATAKDPPATTSPAASQEHTQSNKPDTQRSWSAAMPKCGTQT